MDIAGIKRKHGRPNVVNSKSRSPVTKEVRAASVKAQLANIENQPDCALVEDKICECLTGRSRSGYQRGVAIGLFPKPIRLGSSKRTRLGDLRAALRQLGGSI